MAANVPPEITLELSGGQLTIRTAEAIYRVVVTAPPQTALPAAAQPTALPAEPAAARPTKALASGTLDDDWDSIDLGLAQSAPAGPPDGSQVAPTYDPRKDQGIAEAEAGAAYYRDISHDMYREIGALARRLSMSIRDVRHVNLDNLDLASTGQQLEVAKDELQDVVKMTEQATMRIMDLGEDIQQAVGHTKSIMDRLAPVSVECAPNPEAADNEQLRDKLTQALQGLEAFMAQLGQDPLAGLALQAEALVEQAQAAPPAVDAAPAPAPPAPAPAAPAGPYFNFPLELVFQTVYELCTNEAVKKHIKTMWDTEAEFNAAFIETEMNKVAPPAPDVDNFLNLELKSVLRILFQATENERFQGVLKKMAQTSDQIFLEQSLPLEAMPAAPPAAQAAAPEPAPVAPGPAVAGPSPAVMQGLQDLAQAIAATAASLAPPELPGDLPAMLAQALDNQPDACNIVDPDLLRQLSEAEEHISTSVNAIIESLSFQDLSGQTIYRIVRLLSDFQVQLLAMVVSFGSKLKAKESDERITVDESEKLAQEEVDRVLTNLKASADESAEAADAKLNQDAINDMLASMGF